MSNQIIVNELLSFLLQKLAVMDELSAIQICAMNFSEDDIAAAKLLLYNVLDKHDKMVSGRRDGTKKSLRDIITLYKMIDPDDVPAFVSKDFHMPVNLNHGDITNLTKDIQLLKASVNDVNAKLVASHNTVTDLSKEVEELRKNKMVRSTVDVTHVNLPRGPFLNKSFASAVMSPSPPHVESTSQAPRNVAAPPCTEGDRPKPPDPQPLPAAPAKPNFDDVTSSAPVASGVMPKTTNDEGFVKVQEKRKRRSRPFKKRCDPTPKDTVNN